MWKSPFTAMQSVPPATNTAPAEAAASPFGMAMNAKWEPLCGRESKLSRHCHPLQFPLKSCGFSGAETARKRFLLWKMGFSDTKIAPSPPYTPPGTIEVRNGFEPLSLVFRQAVDGGISPRPPACQKDFWDKLSQSPQNSSVRLSWRACHQPRASSPP